jgi:glutathione S-transferase
LIAFTRGDHRAPEFLALNPKGRVPTLIADGEALNENIAILSWLAEVYPDAGLSSHLAPPMTRAQFIADLSFFASGLHPLVTRIRIPTNFAGPENAEAVWRLAVKAMSDNLSEIELRLGDRLWWSGDQWTILDAYLAWVWFRVAGAGLDPTPFPGIAAHAARYAQRPAAQRVAKREAGAVAVLEAQKFQVRFPAMPWLSTGDATADRRS